MFGRRFGMSLAMAPAMLAAGGGGETAPTSGLYKALNYGHSGHNKYDFVPVNRTQEEARRVRQAERRAAKWRGEA